MKELLELNRPTGKIFILSLGILVFLMVLPFAHAQPVFISIERSDTCKKSATCLGMKDLIPLDTTDKKLAGRFVEKGGDYIRTKPVYKNYFEFYRFSNLTSVVCVECDQGFITHAKNILIESNANLKYVLQRDHIISNNTFYEYSGRIMDNCGAATISSNMTILRDTIQYMASDCKGKTNHAEQTKTVKPYAKISYCGIECQHQKFMKEAKAKSKSTFLINPAIKLKNQNDKVKVN